jgi:hypothetical protein
MRSSFSRTALKDTSFSRLRISEAERGDLSRSTGLIYAAAAYVGNPLSAYVTVRIIQ